MKDKLIKPQEAADYLGITLGTFYNWVSERRIEVVKLNKRLIRVRRSVLEQFTEKGTRLAVKAES